MKEQTNRSSQADYRFQNRIQGLPRWSPPRGGAGITCAIQLLSLSRCAPQLSECFPQSPQGPSRQTSVWVSDYSAWSSVTLSQLRGQVTL